MVAIQEFVLICSEIGTRDYLPDGLKAARFLEVRSWLWEKYPDQIVERVRAQLSYMETPTQERAPLRFDYPDATGTLLHIDLSEDVADIARVTPQAFWHPFPLGGSFRQAFGIHAAELLGRPSYANWKYVVDGRPGYGIRAVGPDPDRIVRTWTVTPSSDYPNSPPVVVAEPPYTNDVCWQGGVLHYTGFAGGSGSPWREHASRSANPLHTLVSELLQKYRLSI